MRLRERSSFRSDESASRPCSLGPTALPLRSSVVSLDRCATPRSLLMACPDRSRVSRCLRRLSSRPARRGEHFSPRHFAVNDTPSDVVHATNPTPPGADNPGVKTPIDDGQYGPCNVSNPTPGSECDPTVDGDDLPPLLLRRQRQRTHLLPDRQGWHFSPRYFAVKHQLMTESMGFVHVTNLTPPGEWSEKPRRAYSRRHH